MSEYFPEAVVAQSAQATQERPAVEAQIVTSRNVDSQAFELPGGVTPVPAETVTFIIAVPAEHAKIDKNKSSQELVNAAVNGGCTAIINMAPKQRVEAVNYVRSPESQQVVREAAEDRKQAFLAKRAAKAKQAESSDTDKSKPQDSEKNVDGQKPVTVVTDSKNTKNHLEANTELIDAARKYQAAAKMQSLSVAERTVKTQATTSEVKAQVMPPVMVPRRGGSGRRQRERLMQAMAEEETEGKKALLKSPTKNRLVDTNPASSDREEQSTTFKNYTQAKKIKLQPANKKTAAKAAVVPIHSEVPKFAAVQPKRIETEVIEKSSAVNILAIEINTKGAQPLGKKISTMTKPVNKIERVAALADSDQKLLEIRLEKQHIPILLSEASADFIPHENVIAESNIADVMGWSLSEAPNFIPEAQALPEVHDVESSKLEFANVVLATSPAELETLNALNESDMAPIAQQLDTILEARNEILEDKDICQQIAQTSEQPLSIQARIPMLVKSAPVEVQNALQTFSETIGDQAPQAVIEVAGLLEVITATVLELETQLAIATGNEDNPSLKILEAQISRQFERLAFCLKLEPSAIQKDTFMTAIHKLALSGNLRALDETKLKDVMHELIQTLTRLASLSTSVPATMSHGVGQLALMLTAVLSEIAPMPT